MAADDWRTRVKRVSVWLKIMAGLVGFFAAGAWTISAFATGNLAAKWNCVAAILTAIAMTAQAASAFIDWRVAPSATWA